MQAHDGAAGYLRCCEKMACGDKIKPTTAACEGLVAVTKTEKEQP